MLIAGVIAICVILAILGFLVPRLSNDARRGSDKGFSLGQRAGGKAPGPIGRLLSKSFGKSRSAADKSHWAASARARRCPSSPPLTRSAGSGARSRTLRFARPAG